MIRKGTLAFTNIMLGNKPVKAVYRGTIKLYPEDEPDTRKDVWINCNYQTDGQAGVTLWVEASENVSVNVAVICTIISANTQTYTFHLGAGTRQSETFRLGYEFSSGSMAVTNIDPNASSDQLYWEGNEARW